MILGCAYRLVNGERLLIPAKFLSGVQVQAVLWNRTYYKETCLILRRRHSITTVALNRHYIIYVTHNKQTQQLNATIII